MYKVTKQFSGRPETPDKSFKNEAEAKAYINEQLEKDYNFKILNTTYHLYEGFDKIGQFTQRDVDFSSKSAASDSSSKGVGAGQSFQPSPFQTAPRPTGLPKSGFKDNEEDDK